MLRDCLFVVVYYMFICFFILTLGRFSLTLWVGRNKVKPKGERYCYDSNFHDIS